MGIVIRESIKYKLRDDKSHFFEEKEFESVFMEAESKTTMIGEVYRVSNGNEVGGSLGTLQNSNRETENNKRPMYRGVWLDNCSWYDKWQFSADLYKNSLLQTKQLKSWVSTHTVRVPHHASILDHFQHLNFDLSDVRSRSNVMVLLGSPYMIATYFI